MTKFDLKSIREPNGDLFGTVSPQGYIGWDADEDHVTLDGLFSIEDLQTLIAHMRANKKER